MIGRANRVTPLSSSRVPRAALVREFVPGTIVWSPELESYYIVVSFSAITDVGTPIGAVNILTGSFIRPETSVTEVLSGTNLKLEVSEA